LAAHHIPHAAAEGAVEAAFAQVLGAEQAAREAIAHARTQAGAIAEAARAETRARAERTRRHIAAARAAFERRLQADLAQLAREGEALKADAPLTEADRACVARAVAQLAAELTTRATAAPLLDPRQGYDRATKAAP
jgi:uncharacterized protein with NAD-binding domain and iron-sulfur cluster